MQNFRTYQLAKELYQKGQKINVKGELRDQLSRALLSVVLNLAEGSGKIGVKDRRRFFTIALGSLREVQACLELIDHPLQKEAHAVGGCLYRLVQNPGSGQRPDD